MTYRFHHYDLVSFCLQFPQPKWNLSPDCIYFLIRTLMRLEGPIELQLHIGVADWLHFHWVENCLFALYLASFLRWLDIHSKYKLAQD